MEAYLVGSLRVILVLGFLSLPTLGQAASSRSQNFIVSAPTKALATEIATYAEKYRRELAISWLGTELPPWHEPCPVRAKVNPRLGAGGATSFLFETQQRQFARPVGDGLFQAKPAGRPFGWEMTLQGSRERVLDSVLPHEITHTIFATHFGRPLPRWADEGACTTVEHDSEKAKQHRMLYDFLWNNRGIAFNQMFAMTEYPDDILPLYSQGFSVARYLIMQGGRQKFVRYIGDGLQTNDWTGMTKRHYGFESISDLQVTWLDWVRDGGRAIPGRDTETLIASANSRTQRSRGATSRTEANPQSFAKTSPNPTTKPVSWYAQQKSKSGSVAESTFRPQSIPNSKPTTTLASRPNPAERKREVLLEWGQASSFLNPTLVPPQTARSAASSWR